MSWFLCTLWPYLVGGLIAWLICGWCARRLKYQPPPKERIVEKMVRVESEAASPRAATPLASASAAPMLDLDAARAAGLKIASQDDFTVIEGVGPAINELIHAAGIRSFAELADTSADTLQSILDGGGRNFKLAVPGTWPDQAHLALHNRWAALKTLQDVLVFGVYPVDAPSAATADDTDELSAARARIASLESQIDAMNAPPALDTAHAKAAGFKLKAMADADDLTVIEGIGPKICSLLHEAGIRRFAQLAQCEEARLQAVLDAAGSRYSLARPGTWAAQARLAANNQWEALKAWQDALDGGEEVQS